MPVYIIEFLYSMDSNRCSCHSSNGGGGGDGGRKDELKKIERYENRISKKKLAWKMFKRLKLNF